MCQISHVSLHFCNSDKTYATDMAGHIPLRASRYSFFMGLHLELYGAQYSLSVTRRPPLGTRCCHQQYCSHKTAEVVVCVCMHYGHTQLPSIRVHHIGHDSSFCCVICLEAHSYVFACRNVCFHWRFTLLHHSSAYFVVDRLATPTTTDSVLTTARLCTHDSRGG